MYNIYQQPYDTDDYHEQDVDVDNDPTTTTMVTTTTTHRTLSEYNPSIDMGQYCGACRYYSHRLHFKKFCKRDYSKFEKLLIIYCYYCVTFSCSCTCN